MLLFVFCTDPLGHLNRAGGSPVPGGSFFQPRLSGGRELPQAGSPFPGGSFSAPADRGTRTAAGVFAPDGRRVFRWDSAGSCALRSAGTCRAPRQGKRVDTKVSTLLTPTSFYFLVWRKPETGDPAARKRERQRILSTVRSTVCSHVSSIRSAGCRAATQAVYSAQAQHNSVAQLVESGDYGRHLQIYLLVAFISLGPVYNNALKNRAALLCHACEDSGLCSGTSDTANRLRKTR